ncbi:MAG: hypothetical protein K5679_02640 [Lachnospiraceae bacterium]|nr:hypothetical protein [Lachnospiraceae bacterium]
MKKTPINKLHVIISLIIGVLLALAGCLFAFKMGFFEDKDALMKNPAGIEIYVGETPITDYSIVQKSGFNGAATELRDYIYKVTGKKLSTKLTFRGVGKYIAVSKDKKIGEYDPHILIEDGNIIIRGRNDEECLKAVKEFANLYLGLSFAGEAREHVLDTVGDAVRIPENVYHNAEPWMREREPIICLWKTSTSRGAYYNSATNLKSEVLSYSDDMLYSYVKMMHDCGFTGIQVTDICAAWAAYGSYEYVQERLRFMADAAHSMGMKFTLWVWGAEFNGYGWDDDTVDYYGVDELEYQFASENPKALETFDKYYSIYAELADCSDRVIGHFHDPTNLKTQEDTAFFARKLRDKFREINPDIDFGIESYMNTIDLYIMDSELDGDVTFYSGVEATDNRAWEDFRAICRDKEFAYGIWSWNLIEMEIDQLAEMNVNSKLIKDAYLRTAEEDEICKPTYWSEMDSYHVANIFSLFCAGRLLQNPGEDSAQVLKEAATAVVGSGFADKMYSVLTLVEDARTGDSYESFKWSMDRDNEKFILLSPNYDAAGICERADAALRDLNEMIDAELTCNTISLPVSVTDLLKIVKSHVKQIREFAAFRIEYEKLAAKPAGEVTTEDVEAIYVPVNEYDVITGLWGQPEARAQYELIERLCEDRGIDVPHNKVFEYYRKQRIYQEFVALQRKADSCSYFDKETGFQFGVAFRKEDTRRLVEELVEEGILSETSSGQVYLKEWKRYKKDF